VVAANRATSAAADRAIEDLGLDAVGRHWSGETGPGASSSAPPARQEGTAFKPRPDQGRCCGIHNTRGRWGTRTPDPRRAPRSRSGNDGSTRTCGSR
jgi:hypothetical protein